MRQATYNRQRATGNMQQATCNRQHATGNVQQATCNRQRATGNVQRKPCTRRGANGKHAPDSRQQAARSQGFKLESLLKLAEIKAVAARSEVTLLHYIAMLVRQKVLPCPITT